MKWSTLFTELKRRNVYKVAVGYAVVAWLLIQAASILFPTFEAPSWLMRAFVVFLAFGFALVVFISWAFEATPEGLKRTEDVPPNIAAKLPSWSRRKFVTFVVVVAAVATGLLIFEIVAHDRETGRAGQQSMPRGRPLALSAPQKSVAVLPFDNLSHDPENAYFCEGVQDEILTRLAKVADLKVISRLSTQRFKAAPADLRDTAKQLGVANILEGSVQKSNDRVRVNVQLVNALTDAHLWADTYDRKLTDIFAVETEIARTIADTLQVKLSGSEQRALAARPTENTQAHQLYLLGRYFWNKRTLADFKKAIDYFNQAIEKDPNYALAYAGLADTYVLLTGYGGGDPKDCFPPAKAAAARALELDGTLGEAHAALANAMVAYDFNISEADREFQRAIELNPNYATAHQWYAESGLAPVGRFGEAIAEVRRALELDPLSVIINADVGTVLTATRHYDEAIEQLHKTVEMDPGFYYAHWNLGNVLELKGRNEEAMAEYKKAIALNDDPLPRALLGHLCAKVGRKNEALEILRQLQASANQQYMSPYNLALIYLELGDKDRAISLLEQAYAEHDGYDIMYIRIDPFLDPLRGDPRFEALAEKIVPATQFMGAVASK